MGGGIDKAYEIISIPTNEFIAPHNGIIRLEVKTMTNTTSNGLGADIDGIHTFYADKIGGNEYRGFTTFIRKGEKITIGYWGAFATKKAQFIPIY